MNGGHVPKPLLRPGQFRIKMVFLNAQLFRRCLIIAEQLNVLVMGSATSTSIQQKASVASIAANQTSVVDIVPATTTEGMRKVKHMQPDAGGDRWQRRCRKQPLSGRCGLPQGTTAGALNIATAGNSKQHVRTQPVCHELRRHRPYSRSYQDLLSYLSQPQRRRQDLSPHPSYFDGAATIIFSLCALCNHSQLGPGRSNDIFY